MEKLLDSYPEILKQWHSSNSVRLEDLSVKSNVKIIWQCLDFNNHIWTAKVADRINNNKLSGCPYCANRKILKGFNDLAHVNPEAVSLWSNNNTISPDSVLSGSNSKFLWKCDTGHEWEASVYSISVKKTGCPYCNNQKLLLGFNDLESRRPDLIEEWDFQKNTVLPSEITSGSSLKVHWVCSNNNNHKWETTVLHRNFHNSGCPSCGNMKEVKVGINDLKSQSSFLTSEFSKENNELPENIYARSTKKYLWVCSNNKEHSWEATPNDRFERNHGCPYCANKRIIIGQNDLATINPNLASELSNKNDIKATDISYGSNKKLIWNCPNGHEYEAKVNMRSQGRGCPKCMQTGFNKGTPALLYILFHSKLGAYKIGITGSNSDRIKRFQKQGWDVIKTFYSSNGEHIAKAEYEALKWVRKDLGLPPFLEKTHTGKTRGWTETFESRRIDRNQLLDKVSDIFKSLCHKCH